MIIVRLSFAATAAVVLAACATTGAPSPSTDLPKEIAVPEGHELVLRAAARGSQIYACRPKAADASAYEWVFVAPEADLLDADGRTLGRHFAGPTWQTADGSKIVGAVKEKAPAQAGNIPWLLLSVKSAEGTGPLARAAFVQRVQTQGGVAPLSGCDAAHAGTEARVPYTATYLFWAPR